MVPKGWEVKKFGNLFSVKSGFGFKHAEYTEIGTPLVKIDNVSHGYMKWDNISYLPDSYQETYSDIVLKKNDILLALNRPITRGMLKIVKLSASDVPSILYQRVGRIDFKSKTLDRDFYFYLLNTAVFRFVSRKSIGSDQPFISTTELKKLDIVKPPLPEQQKIAKILSTWDKAISTTERLIENSTQQKKALMQQLLTGKKRLLDDEGKRFEGEFNQRRLSELVNIDKKSLGKNTPENYEFEYISLSDVSTGTISKSLERHVFSSAPSRARRIVKENDLLLATVRPNLKGFAKARKEHDGFVASTGFAILSAKKDVSSDYVYHYLFSHHLTGQINALVVGSNYPAINSSDVGSLKILCPSFEEQQKIATVLTNADKEIELLEQQLTDLQQEKKALMHVLLTGKKRVVVDGEG